MSNGSNITEQIALDSITPADLAKLLAGVIRRKITEDQIREIAEAGDLLSTAGTINLIRLTAYLLKMEANNG